MNTVSDLLRRIRVRRAKEEPRPNESILTIEEVCAALMERGGYTGSYGEMVKHVKQFFGEMAHQLDGGFGVNTGYFSIHPVDRTGAPLSFDRSVVIEVEEQIDRGYIEYFTDTGTGTVNERVTPGVIFNVEGHKIKVEGNKADCGVWFVSMVDPSLRFKVARALVENLNTRVSGVVPVIPAGKYTIEIKTQYTDGGVLLKEPRTIKGRFPLRNYKILSIKDEEKNEE